MSWWQRVKQQLGIVSQDAKPLLRDYDVLANVATDGEAGETVSMRAALGERKGLWRWCVMCRLLDVFVQRNHCEQTLDPTAVVPASVYWRAGLCFALATAAAIGVVVVLIHWGIVAAGALACAAGSAISAMIRRRPGTR